jgi:hypothetical protein
LRITYTYRMYISYHMTDIYFMLQIHDIPFYIPATRNNTIVKLDLSAILALSVRGVRLQRRAHAHRIGANVIYAAVDELDSRDAIERSREAGQNACIIWNAEFSKVRAIVNSLSKMNTKRAFENFYLLMCCGLTKRRRMPGVYSK